MDIKNKLERISKIFKQEIKIYSQLVKDKRTPFFGKLFIGMALGYALMPFDLIPDWIPIIGILDDLIIIPILVIILQFSHEVIKLPAFVRRGGHQAGAVKIEILSFLSKITI
jgi:uncharacterized membrane protein YkvA (DUF1232 family)